MAASDSAASESAPKGRRERVELVTLGLRQCCVVITAGASILIADIVVPYSSIPAVSYTCKIPQHSIY